MVDGIHPGIQPSLYNLDQIRPPENPMQMHTAVALGRPYPADKIDLSPQALQMLSSERPAHGAENVHGMPLNNLSESDRKKVEALMKEAEQIVLSAQPASRFPDFKILPFEPSQTDLNGWNHIGPNQNVADRRADPFSGDPLRLLGPEEREKARAFMKEMNEILARSQSPEPKVLTDAELKREAEILERMAELHGGAGLTDDDLEKIESINEEMNKILEDGEVSEEEEKKLEDLGKQLSELFSSSVTLTDLQQKELDDLQAELDELHGIKPLSEEDKTRLAEIQKGLGELFAEAFAAIAEQDT